MKALLTFKNSSIHRFASCFFFAGTRFLTIIITSKMEWTQTHVVSYMLIPGDSDIHLFVSSESLSF